MSIKLHTLNFVVFFQWVLKFLFQQEVNLSRLRLQVLSCLVLVVVRISVKNASSRSQWETWASFPYRIWDSLFWLSPFQDSSIIWPFSPRFSTQKYVKLSVGILISIYHYHNFSYCPGRATETNVFHYVLFPKLMFQFLSKVYILWSLCRALW